MSFEPSALFLSFVLGLVGFGLFMYGRKQARVPHLVAGLLYMVYPYFTDTFSSTLIVAVVIAVGLWWAAGAFPD
jgi:hypothetical protein